MAVVIFRERCTIALTWMKNKGGEVTMANDTLLSVQGASELTLYISMATNFVNYKDISGDPYQRNKTYLKNAEKEYDKAKAAHIAAYQSNSTV